MWTAFITPGILPIEGFTMLGINVKPNTSNPIGKFGTGLKYAVAVLLRLGHPIKVFIGDQEYEFFLKPMSFRGKEFQQIRMRKRTIFGSWQRPVKLPYTTEYGKHWELWQVYRELEANTRDEQGITVLWKDPYECWENKIDRQVHSGIFVGGSEFAAEVGGPTFLNTSAQEPIYYDNAQKIEVYVGACRYLYYRGMRVYNLNKQSKYTYNFVGSRDLTEDRTLKYYYSDVLDISSMWMACQEEKLLTPVMTAGKDSFEHSLNFDSGYGTASDMFKKLAMRFRRAKIDATPTVTSWASSYAASRRPTLSDYDRGWNDAIERVSRMEQITTADLLQLKKRPS